MLWAYPKAGEGRLCAICSAHWGVKRGIVQTSMDWAQLKIERLLLLEADVHTCANLCESHTLFVTGNDFFCHISDLSGVFRSHRERDVLLCMSLWMSSNLLTLWGKRINIHLLCFACIWKKCNLRVLYKRHFCAVEFNKSVSWWL